VLRERLHDRRLRIRGAARHVDVLDAQQPFAAGGARVGVARDGSDERAEMQRSGGGGREAPDVALREAQRRGTATLTGVSRGVDVSTAGMR
jgi:hypothetical protein